MMDNFMYGDFTDMGDATDVIPNDSQDDMVSIPRWELDELKETERFMTALEAAGVDNWDGYDFAVELFQSTKK